MLLDTVMLRSGDKQNTITVHVTMSPHCFSFDLTIECALEHRPPQTTPWMDILDDEAGSWIRGWPFRWPAGPPFAIPMANQLPPDGHPDGERDGALQLAIRGWCPRPAQPALMAACSVMPLGLWREGPPQSNCTPKAQGPIAVHLQIPCAALTALAACQHCNLHREVSNGSPSS